jgi:hypothetical protein
MSKLPNQSFSIEDFQEQKDWIGKILSPINKLILDLVGFFNNGITVRDNLYQEIKEIKFVNNSTNLPLKFRTKFQLHPQGLMTIYLFNNTLGEMSAQVPAYSWDYTNGELSIDDLTGLTASSTYTIRVLVIYG